MTEVEALLSARLLARADVELEPMRPLLVRATELAIGLDHPAYDCIYLALAEELSRDLVTADERLCRKPLPTAYKQRVVSLKDFGRS